MVRVTSKLFLKIYSFGDFPGGPVVKTLSSSARAADSQPVVQELGSHVPGSQKNQNVKQKRYCNQFSKDFKNSPQQKKS